SLCRSPMCSPTPRIAASRCGTGLEGTPPPTRPSAGAIRSNGYESETELTTPQTSPRTVYNTATSLDGYIATPDHSLDWLLSREADESGPMGFTEFLAGVGAIVMGANTYQWILDHEGAEPWPYE